MSNEETGSLVSYVDGKDKQKEADAAQKVLPGMIKFVCLVA